MKTWCKAHSQARDITFCFPCKRTLQKNNYFYITEYLHHECEKKISKYLEKSCVLIIYVIPFRR